MQQWIMKGGIVSLVLVCLWMQGCASTTGLQSGDSATVFESGGIDTVRTDVVMAALSQIGTPYVYGGVAPGEALDCSGLTQYAYSAAGLTIPRVSRAQRAAATPIRGPGPGDLVFFKTGPNQYHVGLMVDHQRFIHASTSGNRVQLADLNQAYWQQRYLGAGTFLD
jgi:cell wall-associated NlpC family hydrolase